MLPKTPAQEHWFDVPKFDVKAGDVHDFMEELKGSTKFSMTVSTGESLDNTFSIYGW